MKPLRTFASLLVGLGALVGLAPGAHAQYLKPIVYGKTYSLQNLWNNNGGYLDTRGSGCQGNALCVSTNVSPTRDGGSGTWAILSASGKAVGTPVAAGDSVYLQNLWASNAGYLATRGTGCQGDLMCVSTEASLAGDGGAGIWQIQPDVANGPLLEGVAIHFKNGYSNFTGGYLDTDGNGCMGNDLCVATSPGWNRDRRSTQWSLWNATTALAMNGGCITTDQPQTLLDNGITSLSWDRFGSLTLSNYGGAGTTTDNQVALGTSEVWGIKSSTPLTGSSAGKLCFGGDGNLKITDSAGHDVWHSGTATNYNVILSLSDCKLKLKGADASGSIHVKWTKGTEQCNARHIVNQQPMSRMPYPSSQCWQASSNKMALLFDTETQMELDWVSGTVTLVNNADGSTWFSSYDDSGIGNRNKSRDYNTAAAATLCLQDDGNLVIYDAAGAALWTAGTNTSGVITMALDASGVGFVNSAGMQYARVDAFWDYLLGLWSPPVTITHSAPAWCLGPNAESVILSKAGTVALHWRNRKLQLTNDPLTFAYGDLVSLWVSPQGDHVCFQSDGNLVIYTATGGVVWASNTNNAPSGGTSPNALTLEGMNLAMVDQVKAKDCNQTLENCVYNYNSSKCPVPKPQVPIYPPAMTCAKTSAYTVWQPNAQAGVSQYTAGGFSFIKDDRQGNSDFAGEAWIVGASANYKSINDVYNTVNANSNTGHAMASDITAAERAAQVTSLPTDFAMQMADVGVNATLFHYTPPSPIVDVNAYLAGLNGAEYGSVSVNVLGVTVYSVSADTANVTVSVSYPQDFIKATATFDVGIPVVVSGSVSGSVGINFSGYLSSSEFIVVTTPNISLDVVCQVGIGTKDVSVGVQGDLTLISLSVPFTHDFTFHSGGQSTFKESAQVQVSWLSGSISLYAQAYFLSATKQLAGWNGTTHSWDLFSVGGNL